MPAYSFQKQFVPRIESGDKTHTIRGKRKNRPRPGQTFYGYYAMRTKQCRKLIQSVITRVQDIVIEQGERVCDLEIRASEGLKVYWNIPKITIDGELLARDEAETLAVRDGFRDLLEMSDFWPPERLPFSGDIIHWKRAVVFDDGKDLYV
jgi:hypothetical protein